MDATESAEPSSPRSVTIKLPEASELGLQGPTMIALVAGVTLVLLAGLLQSIVLTSNDPSEGTVDAAVWFSWLGAAALSLSLVFAGIQARTTPGIRVALIIAGIYFFMGASSGGAGIMASLAGFFSAFP